MTERELERFMEKVDERLGCWVWTAALQRGVGAFRREGAAKTQSAARVSYEHFVGRIPYGHEVGVSCGVRACVNPDHLLTLPQGSRSSKVNAQRFSSQTHCKNGHSLQDAYVTPDGRRDCRECGRERKRKYKIDHPAPYVLRTKRYEITCPGCGEKRTVKDTTKDRKCRSCVRRSGVELSCPICGKQFYRSLSYVDRTPPPLHCSTRCRQKAGGYAELGKKLSEERTGTGNPSYLHGRYSGRSIAMWRLENKGEDVCRNCGSSENLHLHHIIPRSKCRATRSEILNGLPLCAKCHMGWHHHKTTIYRDVFTREEWDFLVSVKITGELIEPWLDKRYPDRGVSFRGEHESSDPW